MPKVSIVILTHNALRFCHITLRSLRRTREVDYEVVVVDNASRLPTRLFLTQEYFRGRINRLCLLDQNTFFAEGNNIGVAASARDADYVLLLNSDVEIRDPLWLKKLLAIHQPGISTYGFVPNGAWPRVDGYCLLIDRHLYEKHKLDETFQWWWAVTRLQANVLCDGFSVQGVVQHDELLYHFGGKSGTDFKKAKNREIDPAIVARWFGGLHVTRLESLPTQLQS